MTVPVEMQVNALVQFEQYHIWFTDDGVVLANPAVVEDP